MNDSTVNILGVWVYRLEVVGHDDSAHWEWAAEAIDLGGARRWGICFDDVLHTMMAACRRALADGLTGVMLEDGIHAPYMIDAAAFVANGGEEPADFQI